MMCHRFLRHRFYSLPLGAVPPVQRNSLAFIDFFHSQGQTQDPQGQPFAARPIPFLDSCGDRLDRPPLELPAAKTIPPRRYR